MEILDYLKIPNKAKTACRRLYVNELVSQINATGADKKLIENSIKTMYLSGALTEDTCGLWTFKDDEYYYEIILIFYINVKDRSKIKSLNELLQKSFPNPVIIAYQFGNEYMLSTALKRLNKIEKNKTVIDSIQTTGWFKLDKLHDQLLKKINYKKRNLKDFYESIDYILSAEYLANVTGIIPENIDFAIKTKSLTIQQLLEEKNKLIAQEAEESSIQGKMQCHMKIKEIEQMMESVKIS